MEESLTLKVIASAKSMPKDGKDLRTDEMLRYTAWQGRENCGPTA